MFYFWVYPRFLSFSLCAILVFSPDVVVADVHGRTNYYTIGTFLHTGIVTKYVNFFGTHSILTCNLNNFYEHRKSIIFSSFLLLWCDFLPSSLTSSTALFPATEFLYFIFYLLSDVWVIQVISGVDALKAILITPTRFAVALKMLHVYAIIDSWIWIFNRRDWLIFFSQSKFAQVVNNWTKLQHFNQSTEMFRNVFNKLTHLI